MTDPGLNQRLKQRSRRSGLMIGLSMALTLLVCVTAFTMIYAQLEPVVSDFVGRGDIEAPTPIPTQQPVAQEQAAPTATTAAAPPATEAPAGGDNQANPPATQAAEDNPDEFTPDYQVTGNQSVNLRPGPGISSGEPIMALPLGTPLQFLDEEAATTDPEGDDLSEGMVWMRFRTEDGQEGWIREVDVETYVP